MYNIREQKNNKVVEFKTKKFDDKIQTETVKIYNFS
jgi:hypothetical protein